MKMHPNPKGPLVPVLSRAIPAISLSHSNQVVAYRPVFRWSCIVYMKLLATFKAEDVEPGAPIFDYASFKPRTAARAIVFDEDKVALIHVEEHDYYMLPGGGVEDEDIVTELHREVLEELGCEIEVTGEVGSIEVYFDRWSKKQTDFCYRAKKVRLVADTAPTDFEVEEGHNIVWAQNLDEATQLVKGANPANRDGKLVRARDLLFLQHVTK
jgi:8-oxo-dGTP pyrophosphatase MutT (NUDIX family)